jgi:hypothetical protein
VSFAIGGLFFGCNLVKIGKVVRNKLRAASARSPVIGASILKTAFSTYGYDPIEKKYLTLDSVEGSSEGNDKEDFQGSFLGKYWDQLIEFSQGRVEELGNNNVQIEQKCFFQIRNSTAMIHAVNNTIESIYGKDNPIVLDAVEHDPELLIDFVTTALNSGQGDKWTKTLGVRQLNEADDTQKELWYATFKQVKKMIQNHVNGKHVRILVEHDRKSMYENRVVHARDTQSCYEWLDNNSYTAIVPEATEKMVFAAAMDEVRIQLYKNCKFKSEDLTGSDNEKPQSWEDNKKIFKFDEDYVWLKYWTKLDASGSVYPKGFKTALEAFVVKQCAAPSIIAYNLDGGTRISYDNKGVTLEEWRKFIAEIMNRARYNPKDAYELLISPDAKKILHGCLSEGKYIVEEIEIKESNQEGNREGQQDKQNG